MKQIFISLLILTSSVTCMAQTALTPTNLKTAADSIKYQRKLFPQEQVYVMTDRELYMPSDTIWLRAWVVSSDTNKQVNNSYYLYIELRDAGGFLHNRVRLRADKQGCFSGYFPLSEKLTSNTYTLVAYTFYMLGTNEDFFFKKPIDVITPADMTDGVTVRGLRYREEISDVEMVSGNGYAFINFDVPGDGQYAASVTNVSMNPADSALYIDNMMPLQPKLFDDASIDAIRSGFVRPAYPYEQGSVLSGTVYGNFFTKKPQKNVEVNILGFTDSFFDNTTTDDKGRFLVNIPDVFSDNDSTGYLVQARTKHTIKDNIVFDQLPFPETITGFCPLKDHFVRLKKEHVNDDEQIKLWLSDSRYKKVVMLDEISVKGRTQNSRTYNNFANRSINVNDYYGMKIHSFRELASHLGLRYERDGQGMLHFVERATQGFEIKDTVVEVYVDNMPFENYDLDLLESIFPMDMIMRVDRLSFMQAMSLPGRAFKEGSVVNIILKTPEEMAATSGDYNNFRVARMPVCQKRATFKCATSDYATPVIYWNPSVLYGSDNMAHVIFKAPDAHNAIYRVTLEGISNSCELVHREKYIKIK